MADCKFDNLVKAYTNATTLEERVLLDKAFQHVLTERGHKAIGVYNEIFAFFTQPSTLNLDQFLVWTKPGLSAISYPQPLPQGHHWAPRYHPHNKNLTWVAKNPIEIELKASKKGDERPIFQTNQQIAMAMEADAFAFANSYDWWKMMVVGRLFSTADEWKKIGATQTDGSDGIRNELDKIYNPTNGSSAGFPSHQVGLSIEQNFMCYKDGAYTLCCTNPSDCKSYKVLVNPLEETLKALNACIEKNVITAETSSVKGFTNNQGSVEYAKWVGLVQKIKSIVKEMKTVCTSKYNVCIDSSDLTKCCDEQCSEALKKLNITLGCCVKCKEEDKDKCCCYNQTFAQTEDLALFMNPQDVITIEEVWPLLRNPANLELTAANLGVGRIFELPEVKTGQVYIINKKTIGFHPIDHKYGSADYPEPELHNIWLRQKMHMVLWPSHCVVVKKAT